MIFPIQGDADYANVLFRLPMDGLNNATSFPDIGPSPKTVTRTGSAIISTALGFPAAYFPASYLTIASHADFAIGTGDYTLSFRCQLTTASNYTLVDFRPSATNGPYPAVVVNNAGILGFFWNGNDRIVSSAGAITAGVPYHIAICRSGSSTRMFINGVQVGSTYSDASSIPQSPALIGGTSFYGASFDNGYLWDLQYLRVGLYTANFTPPASKSLFGYGSNKYFHQQPNNQPSFLQTARLGL